MADTDAKLTGWGEVIAAWTAPINRDTAEHEVQQIAKAWMTLALLLQLPIALLSYLLPLLPLGLSGMPWQHIAYAPVLFILGLLFGMMKNRLVRLVIALLFPLLIAAEVYFYVTDHLNMIAVDLNTTSLVLAGIWRAALALLALRGIWAVLALPRR